MERVNRPTEPGNLPLIRASELSQYSFCHRAWWLGTIKGLPSKKQEALTGGIQRHYRHGRQVRVALRWRWIGLILLGGGSLFLAAALLLFWLF
jgi:hypothetical protein